MSMSVERYPDNIESRNQLQSNHGENTTTLPDSLLQYKPHSASTSTSTSTTLSRESVETWIEHTAAARSNPPSPLLDSQQGLKRKRSSSPDPQHPRGSSFYQDKQSLSKLQLDTMGPHTQTPHTPNNPPSNGLFAPTPKDTPTSSKDPTPSEYPTPSENSKSSGGSLPKLSKDPSLIARKMEKHMLFQGSSALDKYPDFKEHVRRVVNVPRPSGVKARSVKKLQEKSEFYKGANEDTILREILPLIMKPERRVHKNGDDITEKDVEQWTVEDYWEDGLGIEVNRLFRKMDLLPNAYLDLGLAKQIAEALVKEDGMKEPKPDCVYGIRPTRFPKPDGTLHTHPYLEIVHQIHQAFLIVEGKSEQGQISQAENQACRGGATLINAARMLLSELGVEDVVGPDSRTYIYSVTQDAKIMEIYVHWAEVGTGPVRYHMNRICSKSLNDDSALEILRRALHNILDWGLVDRYDDLKQRYNMLYEKEKTDEQQRLAAQQAVGSPAAKRGSKRPCPGILK